MYDTSIAIDENISKEQKVMAASPTYNLPACQQKIALQRVLPELRPSQAIAMIGIKFCVD